MSDALRDAEDPIWVVYATAPNLEQARLMGKTVVSEGLAACVNIIAGVLSIYEWQGQLTEEQECCLVLKVPASREPALRARLLSLHPYEIPALVSWPISAGHGAFFKWVREQTEKSVSP